MRHGLNLPTFSVLEKPADSPVFLAEETSPLNLTIDSVTSGQFSGPVVDFAAQQPQAPHEITPSFGAVESHWALVFGFFWVVVAGILFGRVATSLGILMLGRNRSLPSREDEPLQIRLRDLSDQMGIRRRVRLIWALMGAIPYTWGRFALGSYCRRTRESGAKKIWMPF